MNIFGYNHNSVNMASDKYSWNMTMCWVSLYIATGNNGKPNYLRAAMTAELSPTKRKFLGYNKNVYITSFIIKTAMEDMITNHLK